MAKKTRPFWANNQPKAQPQPQEQKINPQILVTLDLARKQVHVNCNFQDWEQAISMLIDALRAAQNQKVNEKKQNVVLAKPQIIIPRS